jgi:hypothetical protein
MHLWHVLHFRFRFLFSMFYLARLQSVTHSAHLLRMEGLA